jgi:hypothetical protein
MNINKELAELLGLERHGEAIRWKDYMPTCSCGKVFPRESSLEWHITHLTPDFTTDSGKIELLRLMEAHPKGKLFFAKLMYRGQNVEAIDDDGYISRHYITDTTGLLAQAAVEFLRRGR